MADEEKGGSPWEMYFLVAGILVVLFIIWIARGGPKATNGGALLNAPPPLGNGQSYTPSYVNQAPNNTPPSTTNN